MDREHFLKLVENRIKASRDVLIIKEEEYSSEQDRLHNFKRAAAMTGCSAPQAIWGMMVKHLVSIWDMMMGRIPDDRDLMSEKFTDAHNYLYLLEAGLIEYKIMMDTTREKMEARIKEIRTKSPD